MNGLKLNLHSFLGLLIYVSIKNLDIVPIFSYLFKGYSFEQITGLKNDETCNHFLTNCLCTYMDSIHWVKNK